jgi:pimeloyl-ACP methyl ester carboxylesterase
MKHTPPAQPRPVAVVATVASTPASRPAVAAAAQPKSGGTLRGFSDVDLTDVLPSITTPALVIQGEADEARLERARQLASLLPNGHLAIIPGISRATQVAPEKSVAAWRDFIREFHSGRSART